MVLQEIVKLSILSFMAYGQIRYMLINIFVSALDLISFIVFMKFKGKNNNTNRGMLPIAALLNVVVSTFLVLECALVGFKRHMFLKETWFSFVFLTFAFILILLWVTIFVVFDGYVQDTLPIETVNDMVKRQKADLKKVKEEATEETEKDK